MAKIDDRRDGTIGGMEEQLLRAQFVNRTSYQFHDLPISPISPPHHPMQLDDSICYCFHVSKRKIVNYLRVHRPRRASELSQCGGAGTGCGWCVAYLKRYFAEFEATGRVGAGRCHSGRLRESACGLHSLRPGNPCRRRDPSAGRVTTKRSEHRAARHVVFCHAARYRPRTASHSATAVVTFSETNISDTPSQRPWPDRCEVQPATADV